MLAHISPSLCLGLICSTLTASGANSNCRKSMLRVAWSSQAGKKNLKRTQRWIHPSKKSWNPIKWRFRRWPTCSFPSFPRWYPKDFWMNLLQCWKKQHPLVPLQEYNSQWQFEQDIIPTNETKQHANPQSRFGTLSFWFLPLFFKKLILRNSTKKFDDSLRIFKPKKTGQILLLSIFWCMFLTTENHQVKGWVIKAPSWYHQFPSLPILDTAVWENEIHLEAHQQSQRHRKIFRSSRLGHKWYTPWN